jgi:oligogalacturonide lyase
MGAMAHEDGRRPGLLRRELVLGGFAAGLAAQDRKHAASERRQFLDAATEFPVTRVTAPSYSSILPRPQQLIFSRRGRFLLYGSDRGGTMQGWAMDLRSGQSRLVTEAANIDPASLSLTPDEKNFCYMDSGALWIASVGGGRQRRVADVPGYAISSGVGITADGPSALVADGGKLRLIPLVRGAAAVIAEGPEIADPMPRPRRAAVAYLGGGGLWLAHTDGGRNFRMKTAQGRVLGARWAPGGRTIYYLSASGEGGRTVYLREHDPDSGEDKPLALTSQFAVFSANSDASVFVGASFSKAQPFVLILVKSVKRELTICEHRNSTPGAVSPVFTPDSQQVYFQTDRLGKPVLFSMNIERLVEKTEAEEDPLTVG